MAAVIPIYPVQNLPIKFGPLYTISPSTGVQTPLTTGTCTIILSTTNTEDSTPADPTFTGAAAHIGNGYWLLIFASTTLSIAKLQAAFGTNRPYVVAVHSAGEWAYSPAEVDFTREAA